MDLARRVTRYANPNLASPYTLTAGFSWIRGHVARRPACRIPGHGDAFDRGAQASRSGFHCNRLAHPLHYAQRPQSQRSSAGARSLLALAWPTHPPRQESDSRGASTGVLDAVGAACGALRTFLRAAAERRAWRSSHLRSARASCSRSRSRDDALACASFAGGNFSGWAFSTGTDISLSAAQDRNFGSKASGSGGTAAASSVRSVGSAAATISKDRAISTSGGGV
jgi:hypothetical protein